MTPGQYLALTGAFVLLGSATADQDRSPYQHHEQPTHQSPVGSYGDREAIARHRLDFGVSELRLGMAGVLGGALAVSLRTIHTASAARRLRWTDAAGFGSATLCGLGVFPVVYEWGIDQHWCAAGQSTALAMGFAHGALGYQLIPMIHRASERMLAKQEGKL